MLPNVKIVRGVDRTYTLEVVFEDDVAGRVDLSDLTKDGIFQALRSPSKFSQVYVGHDGSCVAWNDQLEIDALQLYADVTGKTPEEILSAAYA